MRNPAFHVSQEEKRLCGHGDAPASIPSPPEQGKLAAHAVLVKEVGKQVVLPRPGNHGGDGDELVAVVGFGHTLHHAEIALVHHPLRGHVPVGSPAAHQVAVPAQVAVEAVCADVQPACFRILANWLMETHSSVSMIASASSTLGASRAICS